MKWLFSYCSLLESLPDISKLDFNKVTDMSFMFKDCKNLKSLPNFQNMNINLNSDFKDEGMFDGCILLKDKPDLSKIKNDKNNKGRRHKPIKYK